MDATWAANQLNEFARVIDRLSELEMRSRSDTQEERDDLDREVRRLEPIMRLAENTIRPGLGDYSSEYDEWRERWWNARNAALQAAGLYQYGEEARRRLRPDAPDLVADQFHPWVWEAARPFWESDNRTEAVWVAARAVNGRLQQKLGRHDLGETRLCRSAFSTSEPKPGEPRLRFAGDRTSDTWKSRQVGAENFGVGCFSGIRNPVAHESDLVLDEPVVLEQLAALSLLARWIDECVVEHVA
ncbi:TIGR02391 family protein [Micromonospora chalcea]